MVKPRISNNEIERRMKALKGTLSHTDIGIICDERGFSQSTVYKYLSKSGGKYSTNISIIEAGEALVKKHNSKQKVERSVATEAQ